jgi:hypothetical protein
VRLTSPFSCHEIWEPNLLELSGPHRACYGTALPFTVLVTIVLQRIVVDDDDVVVVVGGGGDFSALSILHDWLSI